MLTTNEVKIETPCGMAWSAMTQREATRRFCGECKKHVNDLSLMTEGEARELLASPSTEGLCVRYFADERGQLVFLPDVPVSSLTRMKRAALAAVTLAAPLSLAACMGAAPAPEPRTQMMGSPAMTSSEVPVAPASATPSASAPVTAPSAPVTAASAPVIAPTVTAPVKKAP